MQKWYHFYFSIYLKYDTPCQILQSKVEGDAWLSFETFTKCFNFCVLRLIMFESMYLIQWPVNMLICRFPKILLLPMLADT